MRCLMYTPFSYNRVICRHIKPEISQECHVVRAEDVSFVSGVVVCCRCHWESRPQEGGRIAQAWSTWPEGASAPNGTMMCRGTEYPRW